MRVQASPSARTSAAGGLRRARVGGGFHLAGGDSVDGLATAAGTPLDSITALLALQDVAAAGTSAEAMVAQGSDLLDRLRGLQADLLDGRLDRRSLADLARAAAAGVPEGADPALARIVRDIEVRAAVELAKLEVEVPVAPAPPAVAGASVLRASCLRAYRDPA